VWKSARKRKGKTSLGVIPSSSVVGGNSALFTNTPLVESDLIVQNQKSLFQINFFSNQKTVFPTSHLLKQSNFQNSASIKNVTPKYISTIPKPAIINLYHFCCKSLAPFCAKLAINVSQA
jgi:hypothetical protein